MKKDKQFNAQLDSIDKNLMDLFWQRMNLISGQEDGNWNKYYNQFKNELEDLSQQYKRASSKETNLFLNDFNDTSTFVDSAFTVSQKAKCDQNPNTINATLGTLYGEDGRIAVIKSIYDSFNRIDDQHKASYAERINGNAPFTSAVFNWINRLENISLAHDVIATTGGTGAINISIKNCLKEHETLLIPQIAWGSYAVMASQQRINVETYGLIKDNKIDLTSLKEKCHRIMAQQQKVVIVINDPCHNPTGISYGKDNWEALIAFFNELSKEGQVVIINDIAYFDYAIECNNATEYMNCFNNISRNILILVAFSCSKSFTAYGMRLGAIIILAQDNRIVTEVSNSFLRSARANWSNVNNGFMDCFVDVMENHKEEYLQEKQELISLLKKRADLFIKQANDCQLPLYPYSEGFFITIPIQDEKLLSKYHQALMNQHIYTVKFNGGIRIAICSLSLKNIDGLPNKLKEVLTQVETT